MSYFQKYLKYKHKYTILKNLHHELLGGSDMDQKIEQYVKVNSTNGDDIIIDYDKDDITTIMELVKIINKYNNKLIMIKMFKINSFSGRKTLLGTMNINGFINDKSDYITIDIENKKIDINNNTNGTNIIKNNSFSFVFINDDYWTVSEIKSYKLKLESYKQSDKKRFLTELESKKKQIKNIEDFINITELLKTLILDVRLYDNNIEKGVLCKSCLEKSGGFCDLEDKNKCELKFIKDGVNIIVKQADINKYKIQFLFNH
jgi:hypothetical protein